MIGQTRFVFTDADMIATQRAGWAWCARWRNILAAYVGITVFTIAVLAGLNTVYGTKGASGDIGFVLLASTAETLLFFGLMFVIARNQGRQVLRKTQRFAWDGDELGGEHEWSWDHNGLHVHHQRRHADVSWNAVGAWLDTRDVLLLFPAGGRAFSVSEPALAAGWKDAPKVFLYPFGGYALALPKRALVAGDANRLIDVLRHAGARERRASGLIAAIS